MSNQNQNGVNPELAFWIHHVAMKMGILPPTTDPTLLGRWDWGDISARLKDSSPELAYEAKRKFRKQWRKCMRKLQHSARDPHANAALQKQLQDMINRMKITPESTKNQAQAAARARRGEVLFELLREARLLKGQAANGTLKIEGVTP